MGVTEQEGAREGARSGASSRSAGDCEWEELSRRVDHVPRWVASSERFYGTGQKELFNRESARDLGRVSFCLTRFKQKKPPPRQFAMARAHDERGGTPAVATLVENRDPQTSASSSSRGITKPAPQTQPTCSHCYKRFKTVEQLETHVAKAQHSSHDPKCGACGKHFANLDTLRQHLVGQLPNKACAERFVASGCHKCLAIGGEGAGPHPTGRGCPFEIELGGETAARSRRAVALDCEMLGDASDGRGAMCCRVCVVDDFGVTLLSTFVKPSATVTDYRTEITGISESNASAIFAGAMSLEECRQTVLSILGIWENESGAVSVDNGADYSDDSNKPTTELDVPLLVGHDLAHDLRCLKIAHLVPQRRTRDTARYPLFQRHTHFPYKLSVLAKLTLHLDIQVPGKEHDPREDALAAMRLFVGGAALCGAHRGKEGFKSKNENSRTREPRFTCWCLDCEWGMSAGAAWQEKSHPTTSAVCSAVSPKLPPICLSPAKKLASPQATKAEKSPATRNGAFALRDVSNV